MKWDFASVTKWGLDQEGPTGQNMFDLAVVELANRLGGTIESAAPMNGYKLAVQIVRDGGKLLVCQTGGAGSAKGSSQFIAASTAAEVYPVLKEMFPRHSVSRLDACEDYSGEGTWDKLEAMLTQVCGQFGVSMSPFGEGHMRPDGTRDATKGRSWYAGSPSSPVRAVLYEKGMQLLAQGIPADPTMVRLEIRVRPSSKAKEMVGTYDLKPADILGFSRWTQAIGEYMGYQDLQRIAIGSVWNPSQQEKLCLKIVRMFDRGIDEMIKAYPPEEIGRMLCKIHKQNREATEALKAIA